MAYDLECFCDQKRRWTLTYIFAHKSAAILYAGQFPEYSWRIKMYDMPDENGEIVWKS